MNTALIASGLLTLARSFEKGQPVTLPYPEALQHGLNRLTLTAIGLDVETPESIADLLGWCHRPLSEWPVEVLEEDEASEGAAATLLDGFFPTDLCSAWACAAADVEAELSEQRLLLGVLSACQTAGAPDSYVAFRRLIIEKPVLTALEMQQQRSSASLELLADHLASAYEPAPAACITRGQELFCCSSCGNLLLRSVAGGLVCEEERCRREASKPHHKPVAGRELRARDEILWLKRGLRRFVAAPGRAELRLEKALRERGLEVELWPQFDAYDLRVRFGDGEAWAVDVKDWAEPRLLARRVNTQAVPIPRAPLWTRAYFVFPQERKEARGDYVRAFKHHCRALSPSLRAAFERDFLRDVDRKVEEAR